MSPPCAGSSIQIRTHFIDECDPALFTAWASRPTPPQTGDPDHSPAVTHRATFSQQGAARQSNAAMKGPSPPWGPLHFAHPSGCAFFFAGSTRAAIPDPCSMGCHLSPRR